jgi:hypothetical protein
MNCLCIKWMMLLRFMWIEFLCSDPIGFLNIYTNFIFKTQSCFVCFSFISSKRLFLHFSVFYNPLDFSVFLFICFPILWTKRHLCVTRDAHIHHPSPKEFRWQVNYLLLSPYLNINYEPNGTSCSTEF